MTRRRQAGQRVRSGAREVEAGQVHAAARRRVAGRGRGVAGDCDRVAGPADRVRVARDDDPRIGDACHGARPRSRCRRVRRAAGSPAPRPVTTIVPRAVPSSSSNPSRVSAMTTPPTRTRWPSRVARSARSASGTDGSADPDDVGSPPAVVTAPRAAAPLGPALRTRSRRQRAPSPHRDRRPIAEGSTLACRMRMDTRRGRSRRRSPCDLR